MITRDAGYQAIVEALAEITRREPGQFAPGMRLVSDLGLESIDTIDLLFEVEKRLGLKVNAADVFQDLRRGQGRRNNFDVGLEELALYLVEMSR